MACGGVTPPLGTSNAVRSLGSTGEHRALLGSCCFPLHWHRQTRARRLGTPPIVPREDGSWSVLPGSCHALADVRGIPLPPPWVPPAWGVRRQAAKMGSQPHMEPPNSPATLEPRAHSQPPPSDGDPGTCTPKPKNTPSLHPTLAGTGCRWGLTGLLRVLLGFPCSRHPLPPLSSLYSSAGPRILPGF